MEKRFHRIADISTHNIPVFLKKERRHTIRFMRMHREKVLCYLLIIHRSCERYVHCSSNCLGNSFQDPFTLIWLTSRLSFDVHFSLRCLYLFGSQLQRLYLNILQRRAAALHCSWGGAVSIFSALLPHMETPMQKGGRVLQTSLNIDEDPNLLTREDILAHVNQLFSALAEDNSDEFLRVAKDRAKLVSEGRGSYLIAPSLLLRWAIEHRALECAKVLLAGKGGHDLKAYVRTRKYEMAPIHLAAAELLPDFVELFLKHGAPVNMRCLYRPADFYYLLPLNIAVKKLSEKILWTPSQFVYRLIFTLCGAMELEQAFRPISQLMRATSLEQNREAFYDYAREGKIIESSILC